MKQQSAKRSVFKKLALAAVSAVMFLTVFSAAGCNGPKIVDDPLVLNVKLYKAGYGDNHYRMMFKAFEQTYKSEGYKVNIVESNSTILFHDVSNELALGNKNGVDMYFTGNLSAYSLVVYSLEQNFQLVEELSDVINAYPIKSNGEAETQKTVLQKCDPFIRTHLQYNGSEPEYAGKYLMMPIHSSPNSFVVNTAALAKFSLPIPVTTDELLHGVNVIAGSLSTANKTYPVAWAGNNALNYWWAAEDQWAAQYDGYENYVQWTSMEGFADPRDAKSVYDRQGFLHSLTVMDTLLNLDYAPPGTVNMMHGNAQHYLMTGQAAYMVNGSWLQNEMISNYSQYINDIQMIPAPIISALGVKLELDGNGGADKVKTDQILSSVVKQIDAGADNAAIKAKISTDFSVTLSDDQIDGVRDARNIYYNRGISDQALVNNYSKKKDIAKLLLRYMASDDSSLLFQTYANAISAYMPNTPLSNDGLSPFMVSVKKLVNSPDSVGINRSYPGESLRNKVALEYFPGSGSSIEKTMASSNGSITGASVWAKCVTTLASGPTSWNTILTNNGII
ncbi:MAG: ABC transporter substrate-binding protein [Firmicutes bacterium]|nr:ABC transporter substrate-binding protein [Bacillota bacterium]